MKNGEDFQTLVGPGIIRLPIGMVCIIASLIINTTLFSMEVLHLFQSKMEDIKYLFLLNGIIVFSFSIPGIMIVHGKPLVLKILQGLCFFTMALALANIILINAPERALIIMLAISLFLSALSLFIFRSMPIYELIAFFKLKREVANKIKNTINNM